MRTQVVHKPCRQVGRTAFGVEDEACSWITGSDCLVQCADDEAGAVSFPDFVADDLACKDMDDSAEEDFRPVKDRFGDVAAPETKRSREGRGQPEGFIRRV